MGLVLATFTLVTQVNKEDEMALAWVPCISYLLHFQNNNQNKMQTLINSSSKVNAITLAYAVKLGFRVRRTNVEAQKIDNSTLKTFEMVQASF